MSSSPQHSLYYDLGIQRVLEPPGTLPQPAWKLDNTPQAKATETLITVQKLHIDSTSFTQIAYTCKYEPASIRTHIMDIIARRGKMHNPVTGSGGVLLGTIEQLDEAYGNRNLSVLRSVYLKLS